MLPLNKVNPKEQAYNLRNDLWLSNGDVRHRQADRRTAVTEGSKVVMLYVDKNVRYFGHISYSMNK